MQLALAADHAGLDLKEELAAFLAALGHSVENLGTHSTDPVDYPDSARAVGEALTATARRTRHRGVRQRRRCLDCGEQDSRDPGSRLP